jgi:hypothetical protein
MHTIKSLALVLAVALGTTACSSLPFSAGTRSSTNTMSVTLGVADKVALLPVANFTDVPQAGLRVEALLEPALRQLGLRQLVLYPSTLNPETLFEPGERKAQAEAEKWARTQGHAVCGDRCCQ